jgi:hypothetical protein
MNGRDSDVYAYHDARGKLVCCGCSISPHDPDTVGYEETSYAAFVAHLRAHQERGDRVPERAFQRLEAEALEEGDLVQPFSTSTDR